MKKSTLLFILILTGYYAYAQRTFKNNFADNIFDSVTQSQDRNVAHRSENFISVFERLDSIDNWRWDTLSYAWILTSKSHHFYYVNNNLVYALLQTTGNGGFTWENMWQDSMAYGMNNNLTMDLTQQWNGSYWDNLTRILYTYDSSNRLIIKLHQSWQGSTSSWRNSIQYLYTYDNNNNLISRLTQTWVSNNWIDSWLYTYTYDGNNNLMTQLSQHWNSGWLNSSQSLYYYDGSYNIINRLAQYWGLGNVWINSDQSIYNYDSNNNLINEQTQNWNGSSWEMFNQDFFTYNINNYQLSDMGQLWDLNSWVNRDSTFNYYSTITATQVLEKKIINVYPNPTNNKITVESNEVINSFELHDITGKLLKNEVVSSKFEVDLSNFKNGIYFLTLNEKGKQVHKKIVKE
jgi:hypothetical protein